MRAAALSLLLLLAAPTAAGAAPVSLTDGVLRYAPGPRSAPQIGFTDGVYTVWDPGVAQTGPGCASEVVGVIQCPWPAGDALLELRFGPEQDSLLLAGLAAYRGSVVDGGAGSDQLQLGAAADVVSGGPGDDRLDGGPGDDRLEGGPGADTLTGGPG
ncbi:MAG TPA: hypothetical protein VD931_21580, partial [Baekduia sp.]|nr:hypothetical protein [Baekduia sp.]